MKIPLTRNRDIYERTIKMIQRGIKTRPAESSISLIEGLAAFAAQAHPGLFCDNRLENWLEVLAHSIAPLEPRVLEARYPIIRALADKPMLLHVATTLYRVGGHVNYLERIAEWDQAHCHLLIVTRQGKHAYNPATVELFEQSGGRVLFLEGSIRERVEILKGLAGCAREVLIHQHPDDATGTLAFGTKENGKVGIVNHADHAFWLGASVADYTLEFRTESLYVSQQFRAISDTRFLPLPVKEPTAKLDSLKEREALGIPADATVFISMGSAHKFHPWKDRNFFQWMDEVLDQVLEGWLIVIGIENREEVVDMGFRHWDRIRLVAPTPEPGPYLAASDFVVDPIPNGSFTAVLEGCAYGCIPVLPSSVHSLFNLGNDPVLSEFAIQAGNPSGILAQIGEFMSNDRQAFLERMAKQMATYHYHKDWISHFPGGWAQKPKLVEVDNATMAEIHDSKYTKVVGRLARVVSQFGGSFSIRDIFHLASLWRASGMGWLKSLKWSISASI